MSTFDWFLVAWWIFGAAMTVGQIGKPRKPIEPAAGAVTVLIILGLVAGLLLSRGAIA